MSGILPAAHLQFTALGGLRLCAWTRAVPERPFWRAYWHPDPGSWLRHAGVLQPLDAAHVVLVPPRTPVQRGLDRPVRALFWHFTAGDTWDRVAGRLYVVPVDQLGRDDLAALLAALLIGGSSPALRSLRLQRLTLQALEAVASDDLQTVPRDAGIERLQAVVRAQPGRPWSVPTLARIARYPLRTCIRRCRAATGLTPHALVLELRLAHAAMLLAGTDQDIEAIAAVCGFADRHHLSRRFTTRYGCGPAAYRVHGG